MLCNKHKKAGFTLVELIVVIIIIAILVAVAIPAITTFQNNARRSRIQSEFRNLVSAAQLYIGDHDGQGYPESLKDLAPYMASSEKGRSLNDVLAKNNGELAHQLNNGVLTSTFISSTSETKVWTYEFLKN